MIHRELQDINPYVRVCAITKTHPGWKLVDRIIYDHQLVLTISGSGETVIDGKRYKSPAGSFFLIKPDTLHSFYACDQNPFTMLVVHFDFFYERDRNFWPHKKYHLTDGGELPEKHLMREVPVFEKNSVFPDRLPVENYSALEVLMKKMLHLYMSSVPGKELLLKACLLEILYMTYAALFSHSAESHLGMDFEKIKPALDHIHEHYGAKTAVKELSGLCSLSPSYFAALFKKQTGYAPNEYVNRVRIEKARKLLLNSALTISEIGEQTGFSDVHYFSAYFRKVEGLSPSLFRQNLLSAPSLE